MKLIDFAGNPLEVGDLVVVKPEFVVGQITEIEDGSILKGLSIDGPQPKAQQQMPHIKFLVHMPGQSVAVPGTNVVTGVLKIQKPVQKADGQ